MRWLLVGVALLGFSHFWAGLYFGESWTEMLPGAAFYAAIFLVLIVVMRVRGRNDKR